jgi:5-methylcytosine-specific restriction protein A
MPAALPRPCPRPGCTGILRNGCCSRCGAARHPSTPAPDARPSAARRGYNHHWRKLRAATLAAEPTAHTGPLCVACLRQGIITPATDLDHIVPKRAGGADTPENLQPLCHACHSRKTGAGA